MTMLDRMRRHKGWLKWSLFIVVVAFVFLYIPTFFDPAGTAGMNDVVASVDGQEITRSRFIRAYQQQMSAYRRAYGPSFDEKLLRQLGIDQRIVQQLIEEEASLSEARRLGIRASDAEVKDRIQSMPFLQENGRFVGEARYVQILSSANPPLRPAEFEDQIRRSIAVQKLQGALTDWITIGDAEVEREFRERNEKVKLAVVSFPADRFREGVSASDAEVAAHFEPNKEQYRIPEKRQIKYALIDQQAIRDRTQVTAQDVQQSYDDNQQMYSTPEQIRASHILLKTEGKDDAAVKKQAEDLLAKIRGGADFGALASKFSEDEVSREKAGDLDYFGRGQMVPEFEQAAFALKPGEVSELVKTSFGYHIIKLEDTKPASKRPLEDVRAAIEDQIKGERARNEAQRIASELAGELTKPEDLDAVAKPRGLTVSESGFFAREEPIAGLGFAPEVGRQAFSLTPGQVSDPIQTPQGIAFITVTGTQESRLPNLDEVQARVREDVVKKKAVDAAREKATALSAGLQAGNLEAAAKSAGLEVKTTDLIARGAPIPEIGVSPAVDAAAFALDPGGVSGPIVTDSGAAVVKVLEKTQPTADEIASGRQTLKDELLRERKSRFFGAYMTKARDRMNIRVNNQMLAQIIA